MNEKFSSWLKNELDQRGMTQADLARKANISKGSISHILNGERNPGLDVLSSIAHALKESPLTLYMAAGIYTPTDIDEALIDRYRLLLKRLSPQKRAKLEEIGWLLVDIEEPAPPEEGIDQAKK